MVTAPFAQRSFDELGTPLSEATFCVLDLETTGGSAQTCHITELGAVKVRAGEVLGTFQTMVNPGTAIPPNITVLTGITDRLVMRAPAINEVLPTFLEFLGGSVLVGHNLRFDMSFIDAATRRRGGPLLGNQRLDTLALARRLLVEEAPSFKLGDLARCLRLDHRPSHRALDDALATADLLHVLIERASAWGVTGLDDLVALPTIAGHPQGKKLKMTVDLPRKPGVYRFLDRDKNILYIGKASDLRARVRSYFSSDRRQKVAQLLRETHSIEHQVCSNTLEAEVLELRLVREKQPRFNRHGRRALRPHYVRLTLSERFPRLSVVRSDTGPGVHLGPLRSQKEAQAAVQAIQAAIPIRRCTTRTPKSGPINTAVVSCSNVQLGVTGCPCSGATTEHDYARIVQLALRALTGEPQLVLEPLDDRIRFLANDERFEEAAALRDNAASFVRAVRRQQKLDMLDRIDRLEIRTPTGDRLIVGRGGSIDEVECSVDESLCVAGWLDRNAGSVRVISSEGSLSLPSHRMRTYVPELKDELSLRQTR